MKTILSFSLAIGLTLLLNASALAADAKHAGPGLGVEDALRIAKEFVRMKNIVVTDSYIDSVHLEQKKPSGDHRKFWIVTWLRNEYANDIAIKGGQIFVHVYLDGTAEVFVGSDAVSVDAYHRISHYYVS